MLISLENLNSFLLIHLTKIRRRSSDASSLLERYQALSIIYISLCCAILTCIWNFIAYFGSPLPTSTVNAAIFPLLIVSILLLKEGRKELSTLALLGCFHVTVFTLSKAVNASLAGLCINIVCTSCGFLLTSSKRVQLLNVVMCIVQDTIITYDIQKVFEITFSQEQADQILRLRISSLHMVVLLGFISHTQKLIETNLWQVAQTNYERAEKINKEVLEAIEAKDVFVSSLSHEIRNPLNAMKGSIDYLSQVVEDPYLAPMIESAKLSGEVLLNLVNNVLDAAKLKSDKMELARIETNILDIVKKVATIHFENLKQKEIMAQMYIDMRLPEILWVDSARLLQIIMNLFSNAIKFTPDKGNVRLCISWCDQGEPVEKLKIPNEIELDLGDPNTATVSSLGRLPKPNGSGDRLIRTQEYSNNITFHDHYLTEFDDIDDRQRGARSFKRSSPKSIVLEDSLYAQNNFLVWNIKNATTINTQGLTDYYLSIKRDQKPPATKGYIKIEVTDNGPGISEDEIPKLFGMFSQANNTIGSKYGGTGLGLWICKQLTQKMGGDIVVHSKVDKGSTFLFYIQVDNQNMP